MPLKSATLAQWILESGRGSSKLAEIHNNFAGMKWRSAMRPYAKRVSYEASDGQGSYCAFNSLEDFVEGYWKFLERAPYEGWETHAGEGDAFIEFIGPIWAEDRRYVEKVINLIDEATNLLENTHRESSLEESDYRDEDDEMSRGTLVSGRAQIVFDSTGNIAQGRNGLEIEYRGDPNCPYGRSATSNKKDFVAIVTHHTAPDHDIDWYVKYQIDGDAERGGHFGYHFYISPERQTVQGVPLGGVLNR